MSKSYRQRRPHYISVLSRTTAKPRGQGCNDNRRATQSLGRRAAKGWIDAATKSATARVYCATNGHNNYLPKMGRNMRRSGLAASLLATLWVAAAFDARPHPGSWLAARRRPWCERPSRWCKARHCRWDSNCRWRSGRRHTRRRTCSRASLRSSLSSPASCARIHFAAGRCVAICLQPHSS